MESERRNIGLELKVIELYRVCIENLIESYGNSILPLYFVIVYKYNNYHY